jgi:hypothetical protein
VSTTEITRTTTVSEVKITLSRGEALALRDVLGLVSRGNPLSKVSFELEKAFPDAWLNNPVRARDGVTLFPYSLSRYED